MNKSIQIQLPTENDTIRIGQHMADCLTSPIVIGFRGQIGAGKTTFIRAMLRQLGIQAAIKSPTFSLVESYEVKDFTIHHFDLYRIHDETELEYIGMRDYFSKNAICCIEWPEHGTGYLDNIDLDLVLKTVDTGRELSLLAHTFQGSQLTSCLESYL